VARKDNEQFKRTLNRPYRYGYAKAGKTVYAYSREEWGLGASSGGGDHNLIRSFYFSLIMAVVFTPVALGCLVLGVLALFKMPIMALVMVFFGALFGFAVLQCLVNVKEEWRGRKARRLKGLPKPWLEAPDDHAYEWFRVHPSPPMPLTSEYFPNSVILGKRAGC
jgi:hypothetical protein